MPRLTSYRLPAASTYYGDMPSVTYVRARYPELQTVPDALLPVVFDHGEDRYSSGWIFGALGGCLLGLFLMDVAATATRE